MFTAVFVLFGTPVTALEVAAFLLTLACVACNVREIHWGWPLAIASSLLYGVLFAANRLYGETALQGVFIALSGWGWRQWLRGAGERVEAALRIRSLGDAGLLRALLAWIVGALALGLALDHWTDSDVPFLDAIPTAGSVLAQWMLARKYLENWWVWIAVNAMSVLLFGWKALWLTALLYAVLGAVAIAGLRSWQARARRAGAAGGPA